MAAAVYFGTFTCQCDRFRRQVEKYPELAEPEDEWSWREANGCDKPAVNPLYYFRGEPLLRCAPKLVEPWAWPYIRIYEQWKLGTLAVAGGVLDQPAKVADAMRIIAHTIADLQKGKGEAPAPGAIPVGGRPPGTFGAANAPVPSTGPHSAKRRR